MAAARHAADRNGTSGIEIRPSFNLPGARHAGPHYDDRFCAVSDLLFFDIGKCADNSTFQHS